jgi:imidazolonepropionase-like amidohydrolase
MRVEHESGTLSPGKYADVIAVRGDVLRNPALLQRVDLVIRHGRRHR